MRWIPCEERLPSNFSEDETVLATTDVDGDRVIPMFAFDVKSFYLKGYISAWMPLPKPYKADRKTEHRDCINCESADDCAKCRGFKDEPQTEREGE